MGVFASLSKDPEYDTIPEALLIGLDNYIELRHEPDGFMRAVLENDLMAAVAYGDKRSIKSLPVLAKLIYNRTPGNCWGSRAKVDVYLSTKPATAQGILDPKPKV